MAHFAPLIATTMVALLTVPRSEAAVAVDPIFQPPTPKPPKGCLLAHNVDFPGSDLTSVKAAPSDKCCQICRSTANCGAFTWTNYNGGTCWLKKSWGTTKILIGADSCWMPNTGQSLGMTFSNCDMPGNDLSSETGKSSVKCAATCTDNASCKAVTWVGANGGTCYYKYDVRECVYKAGAESTVTFSKFVSY